LVSGAVDVVFSDDAANYYSRSTSHLQNDFQKSAQILVANQHPGDNATMWSRGQPGAFFIIDFKNYSLKLTHYC